MNYKDVAKQAIKEALQERLSEEFPITDEIMEQYEKVRQSGRTNMFDSKSVQYYAFHDWDAYELVNYIEEYGSKGYSQILKDYGKWADANPELIESIRDEVESKLEFEESHNRWREMGMKLSFYENRFIIT